MKKWKGIKAVFFDFDDTLGDREKYAYACAKHIIEEHTDITDPLLIETILQDWMLWDEKGNIDKHHVQHMLENKYGILQDYDISANWDKILWNYTVPFPDASFTLEQLQKQYVLGLITNGPSEGQRNKLLQSGLASYFKKENITVSGDYPYKKPDVRIFQKAMKKTEVTPEESVYVGDIFANDITGALQAGMHAVWMWNWGERQCSIEVPVIHHISELLKLLL